jgi:hypothetical protein
VPYRPTQELTYSNLKDHLTKTFSSISNSLDNSLELSLDSIVPQLVFFDDENRRAYIKFNHFVEAFRWEAPNRDERIRRRFRRRHPVVVCFRAELQIVSIEFMGFSQISIADQPIKYHNIAADIIAFLSTALKYEFEASSVKPSIDGLLADPKSRVANAKISMSDTLGRIVLSSSNDELDVPHLMMRFLSSKGIEISLQETRELFTDRPTDDFLLIWHEYEILTRISFEGMAPEILFIWRGVDPSPSLVDIILRRLTKIRRSEMAATEEQIEQYLDHLEPRSVIQPGFLVRRFSVTKDYALGFLLRAKESGDFEFCFRVKPDIAEDEVENPWQTTQANLPSLHSKDGLPIDLFDPKNIEVAFRRVRG